MTRPIIIAAAILLLASTAHADPYAEICGSTTVALGQSNDNEIEFGSERGFSGCTTAGYSFEVADGIHIAAELTARYDNKAIHGQNAGGKDRTADGHTLHMVTVAAGPALSLDTPLEGLSFDLRAGIGGAYVVGLGDNTVAPAALASAGLRYAVTDRFFVSGGYGVVHARDVTLKNGFGSHTDDVTFHGPMLGLRWEFGE